MTPDEETAKDVTGIIPLIQLSYRISFYAKAAEENYIDIKMTELKKSYLLGKARRPALHPGVRPPGLAEKADGGISRQVAIKRTLERPEAYDDAVYLGFINQWTKSVSVEAANFDAIRKAVLNKDDFDPDVITKAIYDEFTHDEGKHEWNRKRAGGTSGSFSFMGILGASGDLKASYSDEGLDSFLKQHGVHLDFTGKQIKPKSLDLQIVNMGDFNDESKVVSSELYLSKYLGIDQKGTLPFGLVTAQAYPDLPTRLADLEKNLRDELRVSGKKLEALKSSERDADKADRSQCSSGYGRDKLQRRRRGTWEIRRGTKGLRCRAGRHTRADAQKCGCRRESFWPAGSPEHWAVSGQCK